MKSIGGHQTNLENNNTSRPSRIGATNNNKGKAKKINQQDSVKMADAATEPASAGTSRLQDDGVAMVSVRHHNHNDSACEFVMKVLLRLIT